MSKKAKKQAPTGKVATTETDTAPRAFDYEAMLTELEAIVAEAEVRLSEEDAAA
jgi:exonuclease VII small subunit